MHYRSISMIVDLLVKESFLLVICSIMIIVGVFKDNKVLDSMYYDLSRCIKNKKLLLCILSTIYGILPIPGRITIATGMFDTCTNKKKDRSELGILAYLATHHYYLWSPLEKSVLLVIASTGMTYIDFICNMWIYIAMLLLATYYYVVFIMKDVSDILVDMAPSPRDSKKIIDSLNLGVGVLLCCAGVFNVALFFPIFAGYVLYRYSTSLRKAYSYIDIKLLSVISIIILISFTIQLHTTDIQAFASQLATRYGLHVALVVSFLAALLLGSSSRFAAITVIMTSIFGVVYMPLFYIIDFCGYLLSPAHKCVSISTMYFKTKFVAFYKTVGIISLILITTALIKYFII